MCAHNQVKSGLPCPAPLMFLIAFTVFIGTSEEVRSQGTTSQESTSRESAQRPPNIVLIVADDLGWNELGCYGQQLIQTPNIDRIAKDGIRFTQFYSAQAVCAPARCSLMTGLHQGHAHVRGNGNPAERGKPRPKDLYFPGQIPIPDETVILPDC